MNGLTCIAPSRDSMRLTALRGRLENHPVFDGLRSMADLRRFMRAHVYAVWDFMSLVKRLQRDLTHVSLPWLPPRDRLASRLINEIVLGEESDTGPNGDPMSHLDMYLGAMREVGADTGQFEAFLSAVEAGTEPSTAMAAVGAPAFAREFVAHTLSVATEGSTLEVMANFFYGREDVIPTMFERLLSQWRIDPNTAPMFVHYLKRHIELDGDSHGPAGASIVARAVDGVAERQAVVIQAATRAIEARLALWDGLNASLGDGARRAEGAASAAQSPA